MENKEISCPKCKSAEIVKRGTFESIAHGKRQRFYCKSCNRKFIEQDGFYRMRNSPQKITCAIDLFYRGVSTRKIQEHFKAFYPHNSSHKSIYKWIIKYSRMISRFTDNLKLQVGNELQVDEVQYKRRISHKHRGIDENWFIDCLDTRTRFMVSSNYVKSRGQEEIRQVVKKAKSRTENQIKIVTTDGLQAYEDIVKRTFGFDKQIKRYNVIHNKVNASRGEGFNYPIERLHNNIRQRTKTFRGFHGSIESANAIMKGFSVYYNFITKHQAINKCPYELAIPELKLTEENKWLELIKMASS